MQLAWSLHIWLIVTDHRRESSVWYVVASTRGITRRTREWVDGKEGCAESLLTRHKNQASSMLDRCPIGLRGEESHNGTPSWRIVVYRQLSYGAFHVRLQEAGRDWTTRRKRGQQDFAHGVGASCVENLSRVVNIADPDVKVACVTSSDPTN